jgi:hypothetical protein
MVYISAQVAASGMPLTWKICVESLKKKVFLLKLILFFVARKGLN